MSSGLFGFLLGFPEAPQPLPIGAAIYVAVHQVRQVTGVQFPGWNGHGELNVVAVSILLQKDLQFRAVHRMKRILSSMLCSFSDSRRIVSTSCSPRRS